MSLVHTVCACSVPPRISGGLETSGYYGEILFRVLSYYRCHCTIVRRWRCLHKVSIKQCLLPLRAIGKEGLKLKTEQLQAIHLVCEGSNSGALRTGTAS